MLSVKDQKKQDRGALVAELERAGAKFRGNAYLCPFHDDHHPSGSIFLAEQGWRYQCQTQGCGKQGDFWDVYAYNEGKTTGDVLKSTGDDSGRSGGKVNRINAPIDTKPVLSYEELLAACPAGKRTPYIYGDEYGKPLMLCIRIDLTNGGKTFRQARPVEGGFLMEAPAKLWPIYNSTLVRSAELVIIVEGEKVCDSLGYFGFDATTSPGGYANAKNASWAGLSGKQVVFWRDNDDPGKQYQDDVIRCLLDLPNPPASIRTVDPERLGLGHKEDAADYVRRLWDAGKTRDDIANDLHAVFDAAEPIKHTGGAAELSGELEAVISGEIVTVPMQWRHLSGLTKAMKPGTITLLAGNPGASKSLALLEQFASWFDAGYSVALYCLEETKIFHTRRILSQRAGLAGLTDDDWTAENPEQARAAMQAHTGFIDAVSRRLWVCPDELPTHTTIGDWIEQRCKDGFRIVCVDPITQAIHKTKEIWNEDKMFLRRCEKLAKEYGVSILLVTHPIKLVSLPDLNNLAGSAAFGRFCQTAIWLQSHEEKESYVMTDLGRTTVTHNRTFHLLKTRSGKGQWLKLAFDFCSETLRLKEFGSIYKQVKSQE